MQRIVTHLWFDSQAEEAANFYVSIFDSSRIVKITRYGKEGYEIHGKPEGSAMTVEFELNGTQFIALNGGSRFEFCEAVSFIIYCGTQNEIDYYWKALSKGGDQDAQQCGWLKDKYGVSWQVIPSFLTKMLDDPDREKSHRVMKALLSMQKIIVRDLEKAYKNMY